MMSSSSSGKSSSSSEEKKDRPDQPEKPASSSSSSSSLKSSSSAAKEDAIPVKFERSESEEPPRSPSGAFGKTKPKPKPLPTPPVADDDQMAPPPVVMDDRVPPAPLTSKVMVLKEGAFKITQRIIKRIITSVYLKVAVVGAALALVLAAPFLLRSESSSRFANAERKLIIISPHNDLIRTEFGNGFSEHMEAKTGELVTIEWRDLGGTSQIVKFLDTSYRAAFEYHWKNEIKTEWEGPDTPGVAAVNYRKPGAFNTPDEHALFEDARQKFLRSNVGIGIDLFFGGGDYDFIKHSRKGHLVDSGLAEKEPDWFTEEVMPAAAGGVQFRDEKFRWIGNCLSGFGIVYNTDTLERIGVNPPNTWEDLGDPLYYGSLALADPTKSGSATKAFEMLIQQQLAQAVAAIDPDKVVDQEAAMADALDDGWTEGLNLIQRIAANARYFSDNSTKIPLDVSQGNSAAGMSIDFFGRSLNEQLRKDDGTSRVQFVLPQAGTAITPDGIGMLRGAPNEDLAKEFMHYLFSTAGQRLWHHRTDSPYGPEEHALRRLPIRKDAYTPNELQHSSDPDVLPYERVTEFEYNGEWTGKYFGVIRFVIQVMCIDSHEELQEAWRVLIDENFPPRATDIFFNVSLVGYSGGSAHLADVLSRDDPIAVQNQRRSLREYFRNNYADAIDLARQGQ